MSKFDPDIDVKLKRQGEDEVLEDQGKTPITNDVQFLGQLSKHSHCQCDGCFLIGKVVKLSIPRTQCYDATHLTTRYTVMWLCENCQRKLANAIEHPEGATAPEEKSSHLLTMPYPIGAIAYVANRCGVLRGHVTQIKVCGYSESDWQGSLNAGNDRRFIICHNSYNEPRAYQLHDVYETEAEALAAVEKGSSHE